MRKVIYVCFLLFIIACKKNKGSSFDGASSDQITYDEDLIYTDDNFKDAKTIFRFGGKNYETDKRTIKIGSIFYTATMLPNEYYIKKNLKINNKDSVKAYIKRFENEKIVQFDFQHEDKKDLLQEEFTGVSYKKSVEYMSNLIKTDFYAITSSGDTIIPSGVLFERNFNLAPRKRILLYFNTKKASDQLRLIYDDKIYRKGIIKFNLKKEK